MADIFDPSPRPSKRPKTYATGRKMLKSPPNQGALSGVSNAISSLSDRLLGRKSLSQQEPLHDDSAYGSKEDSFNEEETIVVADVAKDDGTVDRQEENTRELARNTRRSSRKSGDLKDVQEETDKIGAEAEIAAGKKRPQKSSSSAANTPRMTQPEKRQSQRQSSRKSQTAEEEVDSTELKASKASPKVQTSNKRKGTSKTQGLEATIPIEIIEGEETSQAQGGNGEDPDENTERRPRSSTRTRRKSTKASVEAQAIDEPESVQDNRMKSPSKARAAMQSPQPKGILTPSRRKREGPRKSVVFDECEKTIEEQLGFKDIETSSKKGKKAAQEQSEIPETPHAVEEDEDDMFLDRNPPQDILQSLELSSSFDKFNSTSQAEDTPNVTAIKSVVLSRLTSSSLPTSPPTHLTSQYSTLHSLLTSTIGSGESNSLLLLGSRGSGKSLLINTALSDLSTRHKNDFHIVRLNGFFQTDDGLALREIWRQLGREREGLGEVDNNETAEVSGSYADTMASLLSLLSHPDDFDMDPNAMDLDPPTTTKTSKSVVIILDEFDLFTFHPRQTLLYNLFDIAQSKKAPIAVLGCSTRMDVVECLEKRVKSRFSHRWVHVPSIKSVEGMREVVESVLCVEGGDPDGKENARWNECIKHTFLPSPQVQALIQQTFYTTKSVPDLLSALYIPIATLSLPPSSSNTSKPTPPSTKSKSKPKAKSPTTKTPPSTTPISLPATLPPSPLSLLPTLPTLHLSLLISAARLETLYSLPSTNLNATYTHYLSLLSRSSHGTFPSAASRRGGKHSKKICEGVWEELVGWRCLVPVGTAVGVGGNEGLGGKEELAVRMVRVAFSLEEVAWGVREKFSSREFSEGGRGLGDVLGRWCREE